jgi:uncharacterized iron-regulated membrane protein
MPARLFIDRPTLRRWLRRTHLVLGLAVGAVLVIVAVTGALLVFRAEIEAGAQPASAAGTWDGVSDIGFAAARDRAVAQHPEARLQMLWFPNRARPYYEAAYAVGEKGFAVYARFHPATGEPLPFHRLGWLSWITTLHVNLHLGEFGAWLVAWSTLLFGVILASGLWLWWPGWKPHLWFAIRQGKLRLWDSHRVLGFISAIPLLLIALTGLVWAFPGQVKPLIHWATFSSAPAADAVPPARRKSTVPPMQVTQATDEQLLAAARARVPADSFVFYLTYPQRPDDARQVRLQRGYTPWPYGEVHRLYFDRYSGALLGEVRPGDSLADRFITTWNSALHFGTWGGVPSMILWTAVTLAVPFFSVSGVLLWRRRRRPKAAAPPTKTVDASALAGSRR